MKPTLILGLFANGILAATAAESPKPVNNDANAASAFPQDNFSLASSTNAWCGGYSAYQCAVACGRLGYRCYYCSASYCNCTNRGC